MKLNTIRMRNKEQLSRKDDPQTVEVEIADAWLKVSMDRYLILIAAAERLGRPLIELQHDELLNMAQQIEKERSKS